MILICDACFARYLVPASVFTNGARQVRCARCGHEWQAELKQEASKLARQPDSLVKAEEKLFKPVHAEPKIKEERPLLAPVSFSSPDSSLSSEEKVEPPLTEPPASIQPIPEGSALPALLPNPLWRKLRRFMGMLVVLLVFGVAVFCVMKRNDLAKAWPALDPVYSALGLPVWHIGDGFSLQNINSERRFEEGVMRLVVSGEIRNDTDGEQVVPSVMIIAVGADGNEMQSWPTSSTVNRLGAGASAPFILTVASPPEAIAEINLRFIERAEHDDKTPELKPAELKSPDIQP